jgi:DNA-packaging protein gp3
MRRIYPKLTPDELITCIDDYFTFIKGKYRMKKVPAKEAGKITRTKVWDREPEPATISGLALFLGFSSRQMFDACEHKGKLAQIMRRGRLRIEAEYEKRLHQHSTSGAIFALKSMGWKDGKPDDTSTSRTLIVKINETGPTPATTEKEVIIEE